jgi:cytidylate kinase
MEVLQEAAESLGASEEAFRGKYETTPGLWARLTREREIYVLAVQASLADWCTRGDLVYHGLSGQHLLRGLPGILRLRLIAPMEKRVKALLASHPQMSDSEAESFIRKVDQDRSQWVKAMYGVEVTDSNNYDLTINLTRHSLQSACETVVTAVAQPRFQITDEVEEELFAFAAECRDRLSRARGG